jgi:hypothetical protein
MWQYEVLTASHITLNGETQSYGYCELKILHKSSSFPKTMQPNAMQCADDIASKAKYYQSPDLIQISAI